MNHVKRIMTDCECIVGQDYLGCRELLINEGLKTTICLGSEKQIIYISFVPRYSNVIEGS